MKFIKFILFVCLFMVPFIPMIAVHAYLAHMENDCIMQETQNGADINFAKYIC